MATSTPKITLYWLNQSRAQRIVWLLEELKVPYEIEIYKRQNMLAPPAAKKIHPLGKFPMVKVDDTVIAESGLMTEVLVERCGPQLAPDRADEKEYLRYRYYMHYAEGSFIPLMVNKIIFAAMLKNSPFFIRPVVNMLVSAVNRTFLDPTFTTHFDFLEGELEGREYLCAGKLTGADILMSFPLLSTQGRLPMFTKEKYPRLWAYCDRLQAHESFKKAEEKTKADEGHTLGVLDEV